MFKLLSKGLPAIFTAAVILVLAGSYYASKIYTVMNDTLPLAQTEKVVLTRGSTIRTLAGQLQDKGLLEEKNPFLIWGKVKRQSTRLQA
ncbi:MAG TPA: hypothetical protein ENJ87_05045, partial [Gammaproteobacteria bacterium]|nr:hypothetical protein [Gammaproteobacteria bacterium]